MTTIRFGTDGWRAIIADTYTLDNVARVSAGTAAFMNARKMTTAVIGFDCRFGGLMFTQEAARVLAHHGIKVLMADEFVSTPMVSLGVVELKADMGVVITASHNPPSYNGYKLKSSYGGPTIPVDISAVEECVPPSVDRSSIPSFDSFVKSGQIEIIDLETMYINAVKVAFDLDAIRNAPFGIAYDAMYGAGQNVMKELFPNAELLHCDVNPSFRGQAPEPIARNLKELSSVIASRDDLHVGVANDGDADRIGMFDEDGNFVDSHHLLLLLVYYLHEKKKLNGKVIVTFSVTNKMKKLCELYNLPCEVTKIGFKYIAEIMTKEDILVGGEESGGLAVTGHIPERDGIWVGLTILEFMAKEGKTLKQLVADLYERVGSFAFDRDDLHITQEKKEAVIASCKADDFSAFGSYQVQSRETIDGFKYFLSDDEWVMIRPSGTEPVLRVYAQAPNAVGVRSILDAVQATIL